MFTSFSRWKRDLSYTSQLPCVQTEEGKKDSQDQGLIVPSSPQTDISNTRSSDACKKRSLSHKDAEHESASCAPRPQSLGRRRQTRERGPGILEKENPPRSSSEGSPNPCEDAQSSKFQRRESKQKEGVLKRTPSASN